ncbi:MAG: peptidoglycan-binding protein [Propionibacteriales bacterium]|nr:peptidoglycan-binding protein [Propionibacteriales bacterium]
MRKTIRTSIASGLTLLALAAVTACGPTNADTGAAVPPSQQVPSPAANNTSPSASASPSASSSSASPSASTSPKPAALLKGGSKGDKVRELQVRLRSLGWLSGEITQTYTDTTAAAVKGFQAKRKLAATGQVDQKTWDALEKMTKKPTRDEMYNVLRAGKAILKKGSTGAKVSELQARLKQVGWFSANVTKSYGDQTVTAVKGFQAKRAIPRTGEVDQRTWDKLTSMTRQPTKAELNNEKPKPNTSAAKLDKRCLTGRVICISKTTRQLVWVVDGKVQLTMDARFGSQANITREGTFSIFRKVRDEYSREYKSPMPYAMYFSGGEAVHYSADFAARGYAGASHGCVNIRNKQGVAWLYGQVRIGDKVVVHW